MKNKFLVRSLLGVWLVVGLSCMKQDLTNQVRFVEAVDPGNPNKPQPATLKEASKFPIGFGIDKTPMIESETYRNVVKANADAVTFGYQMKHGAMVTNTGILDFTSTDQLYNNVTEAGLTVFGHTLAWHQNQNATYLKAVANGQISGSSGVGSSGGPMIIYNEGFEKWSNDLPAGWTVLNKNYGSFTQGSGAKNVHGGSYSLQVNIEKEDASPSNWKLQIQGPDFTTIADHDYQVTFWIRASGAKAKWQMETRTGGATNYSGDQETPLTWTRQSVNFKAKGDKTSIVFDMGNTAVGIITYIDDLQVEDITPRSGTGSLPLGTPAEEVDAALKTWITEMVSHYKGKVTAWDVVNEPMADGQSGLRTSANTNVAPGATDIFFWSEYIGRSYALKAFNYAHAADPDALLFINDYNLESNTAKLDSLIGFVSELTGQGAPIDGIGTQMHIHINTSNDAIDQAFIKLAATGLLIRVSELDVRVNPNDAGNFNFSSQIASEQANKYKYVVSSYIKNIPEAQRAGITIWGVGDADSWINVTQKKNDFPLLFDKNYQKKPAFDSVLEALLIP